MKKYEKIVITNLPAFYKIRLFNEINKRIPLLVLFTGHASDGRNSDFYKGNIEFDYINLNKGLLGNFFTLIKVLQNNCKEIILGGWDNCWYWMPLIINPKQNNSVIVESSIHESKISGVRGTIKRIFLSHCTKVYVPGKSNANLVKQLGFKGQIIKTKGCGIFNYIKQPQYIEHKEVKRFIYVGRLAEVKNVSLLIRTFNDFPELILDIVGFGPLEVELKKMANSNIIFHGAVDNKDLPSYYNTANVFVLPSLSEPWGIVVEEALNNGLPVIVSDKVGCAEELVNNSNGIIFKSGDIYSLKKAIKKISDINYYNYLRYNISKLEFEVIEKEQVKCYL